MLKNTRIKIEPLRESIDALRALVLEAKIAFTPEGLRTRAVDAANVAMVSMDLGTGAFEKYEATDCEIGIDLNKFNGILEMAPKDSIVELNLDEKTHKLNIKMGGLAYDMALLDPNGMRKDPKIPSLEMPANIVIRGDDLKFGIKAAEKVSDYVFFTADGLKFSMTAQGDTDAVVYDVPKDNLISLTITGKQNVKSLFSMDYLKDLKKGMGSRDVTMELGDNYPVKISHPISDGKGHVTYMIAPRVEQAD